AGFARDVVVKRMHQRLSHDDDYVRMFLDEARLTATLQHPNIAQVIDLGRADDSWFIAMEFVDGPDLGRAVSQVIRQGKQVPVDLSSWVIARAASGLHYAHTKVDPMSGASLGLIHRDVSHANVLLSRHGDVKVIDFGIAQANQRHSVTQTGVVKGKPGYLSPEQIHGQPLSPRVDVFALGVVLWELLTGQVLFRQTEHLASMERTLDFVPPPPSSIRAEVSPDIDSIVLAALEKDPNQRIADAAQLSRLLDDCIRSQPHANRQAVSRWVRQQTSAIWPPKELRHVLMQRSQSLGDQIPGLVDAGQMSAEKSLSRRLPTEPRAGERTRRGGAGAVKRLYSSSSDVVTEPSGRPANRKWQNTASKDNLDRTLKPIVGRTETLRKLTSALAGDNRMLSLTGEAGVGKSRLAAAFALAAAPRFAAYGGSWRCALTSCENSEDICRVVASTLGLQLGDVTTAERSAESIAQALAGRGATFLWLDDAGKQRQSVADLVSKWLRASAKLWIVATSRRPLELRGECVVQVPPLSLVGDGDSDAAALLKVKIAEGGGNPDTLLSEKVRANHLLHDTAGLPMAIELAAARIVRDGKIETPDSIEQDPNPPLTTALQEAWNQLVHWEQSSLVHACMFSAGFDRESLGAVLQLRGFDDQFAAADEAIDNLSRCSLFTRMPGQDNRFAVHDNIRSWVVQHHLQAQALRQELDARHRGWAVELAERCDLALRGHNGHAARDKLTLEMDNLLAVYRRAVGIDDLVCLRLSVALGHYLLERGPLGLIDSMLNQALGANQDRSDALIARALTVQAEVKTRCGAPKQGLDAAQRALDISRALDDDYAQAVAWLRIGECHRRMDANSDAMRAAIHARELADTLEDITLETGAIHLFGCLYFDLNEKVPARRCFEASQAGAQRIGDHHLAARAQANLGCILADMGELDEAEQCFIAALDHEHLLGNRRGAALCTCYLALVAQERRDYERADRLFVQATRWLKEVGDQFRRAYVVGFQSWSLLEQGQWEQADELLSLTVAFFLDKGDRKLRVMHLAFHALCLMQMALADEADESLDIAEQELEESDDPTAHSVAKLMRLCCFGDQDPRVANAEAEALAPRPPQNKPRPSLAASSAEVRFALRLVERWGV
ncbi:MAG TPA: hypothetical protein DCQ06_00685, partial [Myxococcales bacterium]|nr:hypothetical protein [Myxococcales bacterium]